MSAVRYIHVQTPQHVRQRWRAGQEETSGGGIGTLAHKPLQRRATATHLSLVLLLPAGSDNR